jgi:hypothetical protein
MNHICFYCEHVIKVQKEYLVSFYIQNEEREETLCSECYKEWLQGLKE